MPATTNPVIIAQRIRRLASALCITQKELAAMFAVHHLTVKRWATAAQVPTLHHQRLLEQLERVNAERVASVPLEPFISWSLTGGGRSMTEQYPYQRYPRSRTASVVYLVAIALLAFAALIWVCMARAAEPLSATPVAPTMPTVSIENQLALTKLETKFMRLQQQEDALKQEFSQLQSRMCQVGPGDTNRYILVNDQDDTWRCQIQPVAASRPPIKPPVELPKATTSTTTPKPKEKQ